MVTLLSLFMSIYTCSVTVYCTCMLWISYNRIISILQDGRTGLMVASLGGFVDTVRVLLEAKADPNITDDVRLHYTATVCTIVT